jgi:Ca2+-binding RTX toxin-like protein
MISPAPIPDGQALLPHAGDSVVVSSNAELAAALDTAAGGTTILLEAGDYADFAYSGQNRIWDGDTITLRSADPDAPAVLSGTVRFSYLQDVRFADLSFDAGRLADTPYSTWVSVSQSSDIQMERISVRGHLATEAEGKDPRDPDTEWTDPIAGFARALGLKFSDVDGLLLRDSEFTELKTAVLLERVSDAYVDDIHVHHVRGGLNFTDAETLSITNSLFENLTPWLNPTDPLYDKTRHDHPDMIQYWSNGAIRGISHVTIADNVLRMPEGEISQSIFGQMNNPAPGVTASDFTISRNIIVNGHPNAIRLGDVHGGRITDNVLLPNGPEVHAAWSPQISLPRSSRNFTVDNNALVPWFNGFLLARSPASLAADNITVGDWTFLSNDPDSPDYFGGISPKARLTALAPDGAAVGGGRGDDTLVGGTAGDTITLRVGSDLAIGGAGGDLFVIDGRGHDSGGRHRIIDLDFDAGDRIELRFFDTGSSVTLASQTDLEAFAARPGAAAAGNLDGTELVLTDGSGKTLTLQLDGVAVDAPGPPPDGVVLRGGAGDDTLTGGGGDDTLVLQRGSDLATGQAGADDFVISGRGHDSGGHHRITDLDFDAGDAVHLRFFDSGGNIVLRDAAALEAFVQRPDVTATEAGGGTELVFTDAADVRLTLQLDGIAIGAPAPPPPPPVEGRLLRGTAADDTLIGGAGDDTLLMRHGADIATGKGGADSFVFDWRYRTPDDRHQVTDLTFAEGDTLQVRFFGAGSFQIASAEDFAAAEARAGVSVTDMAGARLLRLDGGAEGVAEILFDL